MPDLNTAYTWAINTCNAPNVGYSQAYRNQRTVNGITYYDCSSFIWYALIAGGWDPESVYGSSWPFVTADMQSVLVQLGWQLMPIGGEWLPGDIVWRSGHVEMVYEGGHGDGRTMGAHNASEPLADQVSIRPLTASHYNTYTALYRYGSGGASGEGASIYVISAILGNWEQESGLNPGVWQGLSTGHTWTDLLVGYGLGQWTNTQGNIHGRLYQLHEYLTANGYADDSGDGELAFFIDENVWYQTGYASAYSDLQDFLASSDTDIEALTKAFAEGWEGLIDSSITTRVSNAQKWYSWLRTHGNDVPGDWETGNRYLSVPERENNALLIYRYLSIAGGGGGGGSPWITVSKMPVWMMCLRHF